jgi:hypothetical protein
MRFLSPKATGSWPDVYTARLKTMTTSQNVLRSNGSSPISRAGTRDSASLAPTGLSLNRLAEFTHFPLVDSGFVYLI